MRRSVKLCLYALAIAGLIAGVVAGLKTNRSISVDVDGQARTVHSTAATVAGVLHDAKLHVGEHDVLAPAASTRVHNGSHVELRRGRLLKLIVDGRSRDVWTTDRTVDQALADLGYGSGRTIGVSRSNRLPLTPTELTLVTPKRVTILADKKTYHVVTTASTVRDAVTGAHLKLAATDRVKPASEDRPAAGMQIVVTRVRLASQTATETVPYKTQSTKDPSLYRGTTQVVRAGKKGSARVTYQLVYLNGKLSQRRVITSTVLVKPVAQMQKVGSMSPDEAASRDPSAAKALARSMLGAHGWGDDQFGCLVSLWTKESGWRVNAANPSGAYGIPQSLPGDKMASSGPNWQSNARTQITWGLGYIASRWGDPCGAWSHSQATNWY